MQQLNKIYIYHQLSENIHMLELMINIKYMNEGKQG